MSASQLDVARPSSRTVAVCLLGTMLCVLTGILLPGTADAISSVNTLEFDYTGAAQTWTPPAGVVEATITLLGAGGGQGGGTAAAADGGLGGKLVATIPVVPGDNYNVVVGGAGKNSAAGGAGGFNGGGKGGVQTNSFTSALVSSAGGGGGASDIGPTGGDASTRLLVAGGGAGSSASGSPPDFLLGNREAQPGGNGSGANDATAGGTAPVDGANEPGAGGGAPGGATDGGAGGPGGAGVVAGGAAGSATSGGEGGSSNAGGAGGGGGGGWFGGGGGGASNAATRPGGGGGGGSGHSPPGATGVTALAGTNGGNGHMTIQYVVPVAPTISGTAPDGAVGTPYSYPFVVTGTPAPTCSVTSGTLPPWMTLDATGCALTGTPDTTGHYAFTVTADNGTTPDHVDVTMAVPGSPTITGDLPAGAVGDHYAFAFTVSGEPVAGCSLGADPLPDGIGLDAATCTLSGDPTTGGAYPLEVTASNGTAPDAVFTGTLTITQAPALTDLSDLTATVGVAYSHQLPVVGYPEPVVTLIGPDYLPAGLDMDEHGLITGTPTSIDAKFGLGIRLTNSVGERSYSLHVFVGGVPPVLTSGDPGDATFDASYSFTFTATGVPAPTFGIQGTLPQGLHLDSQTGELSGTPKQLGDFPVTVTPGNGYGTPESHDYTLRVTGTAPSIGADPPPAQAGVTYHFQLDTGNSNPKPTFTTVSGGLPVGFSLSGDGAIDGFSTTLTPGTPITVKATNGVGTDATKTFTLSVVAGPPSIGQHPPATATVGKNYYFRYLVRGVPEPTVSVPPGSLPPGLSFSSFSEISGTPTTPGIYQFTVTATNGTIDATSTDTITVLPDPATVSGVPTPLAPIGVPYSFAYTVHGAPAPAVTAGPGLPPGITLSPDGHLTGTPTTAGTYTFTVTADNGAVPAATVSSTIVVPPRVSISGSPPAGGVGEPYSFTFTTAGSPTVTKSAGTIPPGLRLTSAGRLSGTPTCAGTYRFTLRAASSTGAAVTRVVTVQIKPLPALSVADHSTNEGNSGTHSSIFTITLSRASTVPVTVHWATANNTAAAGSDYVAGSGVLTFAPGQTSRTASVQVKGDRTKENSETFIVGLSQPTHAVLARAKAVGTIVNDD